MIFNLTTPAVSKLPKFTYTGTYTLIDDGNGNWRIKFLTSGKFTPAKDMTVDVFIVGGGGGGAGRGRGSSEWPILPGAGGGGGYTTTARKVKLIANTPYDVSVGSGGAPSYSPTNVQGSATAGGSASAFNYSARGGDGAHLREGAGSGGSGGSFGGAAAGSDGSNGGTSATARTGGTGQGSTTREFGESGGELYAGGGGSNALRSTTGSGGLGGGGNVNENGKTNTGGGGGSPAGQQGVGYGGSGIVIIRNARG